MVAIEPNLGDILPSGVLGNLLWLQVAVVVNNGHILGVVLIELLGWRAVEKEIFADEFIVGHYRSPLSLKKPSQGGGILLAFLR